MLFICCYIYLLNVIIHTLFKSHLIYLKTDNDDGITTQVYFYTYMYDSHFYECSNCFESIQVFFNYFLFSVFPLRFNDNTKRTNAVLQQL